nr:exodeoxyribonuclease VII large subunit [Helicobacter cinaedi]
MLNTLVQGEKAKESIATNIAYIDSFFGTPKGFDVIIIGRGGGSMEIYGRLMKKLSQTPFIMLGHQSLAQWGTKAIW